MNKRTRGIATELNGAFRFSHTTLLAIADARLTLTRTGQREDCTGKKGDMNTIDSYL